MQQHVGAGELAIPGGAHRDGALLHGSEVRTDPPSPDRGLRHSVAVLHPKQCHRVEDLARELYLDALACRRFELSYIDR